MHNYEYLRLATSSLHILCIVASLVVAWVYSNKIIIEEDLLLYKNLPIILIIIFCFLFAGGNAVYISNFFDRIPVYFYKIPLLFSCLVFLILLINVNRKS